MAVMRDGVRTLIKLDSPDRREISLSLSLYIYIYVYIHGLARRAKKFSKVLYVALFV